ncbi:F-box only protein 8 [Dissostichus eleginoides]|nr:F-box only protein 8 [Dissostichus eleginoides]
MGQALWRLPPRQQQQLQEELADRLADQEAGQEQGRDGGPQRRAPQQCYGPDIYHLLRTRIGGKERHGFIDLEMLPPELGITILSYLNATDLCLAGCVWQDLGNDEYLWQG